MFLGAGRCLVEREGCLVSDGGHLVRNREGCLTWGGG